jgi:hypothetical protein
VGLGGTVPGTGGFDDGCAVSTGPVAAVVIGVAALWKWSMTRWGNSAQVVPFSP